MLSAPARPFRTFAAALPARTLSSALPVRLSLVVPVKDASIDSMFAPNIKVVAVSRATPFMRVIPSNPSLRFSVTVSSSVATVPVLIRLTLYRSFSLPPCRMSAPPLPTSVFRPSLPMMVLALALPVPMMLAEPVSVRFSSCSWPARLRSKLTELLTRSISAASVELSLIASPMSSII